MSPKFSEVPNQDRFLSLNRCASIPCLPFLLMVTLSCVAWGPRGWRTVLFFLALPVCILPSFRKLCSVCQMCMNSGTKTLLFSQAFTNNLTACKLFKSNLARVLRTSNHILVSAALTIFGHIFPLFWALRWSFLHTKCKFAHSKFWEKHGLFFLFFLWLSGPSQQNSTEESFPMVVPSPGCPPQPTPNHNDCVLGDLPSNLQNKTSG